MAFEYYDILWVSKDASAEDIKKAYRKKAMENHPDRHGGDKEKEAAFKKINEAYSVLSDDQKKAHYDRFGSMDGAGWFGAGGFNGDFDFSDIFESFFGGGFAQQGGRTRKKEEVGEDVEIRIHLTFAEALSGIKKTVRFDRMSVCEDCKGSGAKAGSGVKECHECHGSGQVRRRTQTFFGVMEQVASCPVCEGTGKIIEEKCPSCHGKKRVRKSVEKEVEVPAGIDDGMTIKIRGEGHEWVSGKNGDLYVSFSVPESFEGLTRDDINLHYELSIDPVEAILGSKKKIRLPVIGERTIELKSGTQHGEIIKLKNDGVKHVSRDLRGDLFIHINIRIPTAISKKERELYETIAKEKKLDVADGKGVFGKIFGE